MHAIAGMDFLFDADLSDLYSDEGLMFGHQDIGPWALIAKDVAEWLIRYN